MRTEEKPIPWAGVAIIRDRRILTLKENDKPFQLIPGGKREPGETDKEAAARELMEELGVGVVVKDEIARIGEVSKATGQLIRFLVFEGELQAEPNPNSLPGKTVSLAFIDSSYETEGYEVGNLPKQLLPILVEQDLID
jgi:8-oxo-dGTP diphosphatase